MSVNPILQRVAEKDKDAYVRDYLHAFKTGQTVQEVGTECGEKVFNINLNIIIAMGMKD